MERQTCRTRTRCYLRCVLGGSNVVLLAPGLIPPVGDRALTVGVCGLVARGILFRSDSVRTMKDLEVRHRPEDVDDANG